MNGARPARDAGLQAVTEPTAGMQSVQQSKAMLTEAEQQVARLEHRGVPVATGFLVGPGLLLTAGHAVRLGLGACGAEPVSAMVAVFDHGADTGHPLARHGVRIPLAALLDSSPPATDDPVPDGVPTEDDGLDFALVRLERHPPDVLDPSGVRRPRGYYGLSPDEYTFGSGTLNVFHHSLRPDPDHGRSRRERLSPDGRRLRYQGANTLEGSSGSPVVTGDGRLVALHHGYRGNENQAVPTRLIAERVLAGPHAALLRRALDGLRHHAGPQYPAAAGATAVGGAMGALLGPWPARSAAVGLDGEPVRAADARETAEHFRTADPRRALGIDPVVEAARAMDTTAGDGAATAAVLAAALIREAADRCTAGAEPREVARGAVEALARARDALSGLVAPCTRPGAVTRAATADRHLADAVSAAASLAGPHGILVCEPGVTRTVETPVVRQGLRLPAGHAFPYTTVAGADPWTRRIRLVRPYVLLLDCVTGDGEAFARLRGRIASEGSPLLILTTADTSDPRAGLLRALGDAADGPVPTVVRVASVANRHHRLRALALLTGATALTEDSQVLPGTAWFDVLGRVDLALVSARETVLVGGDRDPAVLDRWIAAAPARRALADSDDEREALDEQLAWLTSRAVTLAVGAETAEELAPRAAAAQRAARAAQAALRSGTVPGGGHALLCVRAALPPDSGSVGTDVVRAALAAPFRLLASRAGIDPVEIERLCAEPDPGRLARERPFADLAGDRPYGDRPYGDSPYGERSYGEGPDGNGPDGDGSGGDGPRDAVEILDLALEAAAKALVVFLDTV